uniref:Uncharacterized protein n=1 Tax=Nelumbo nucifera TaxID=4432 RepID=A0A822XTT7_NELNU|nr:TPA_asm: hypothetical protein HUJ06_022321 [Nelumbo nucifera]
MRTTKMIHVGEDPLNHSHYDLFSRIFPICSQIIETLFCGLPIVHLLAINDGSLHSSAEYFQLGCDCAMIDLLLNNLNAI